MCILRTSANSEDEDEMLQNAAFHQGLQSLLNTDIQRQKLFYLDIITCDPLTMDHPQFIVSNQKENTSVQ